MSKFNIFFHTDPENYIDFGVEIPYLKKIVFLVRNIAMICKIIFFINFLDLPLDLAFMFTAILKFLLIAVVGYPTYEQKPKNCFQVAIKSVIYLDN